MAQLRETVDDAVARLHPQATGGRPRSRVALTCEHASLRIPDAWPAGWPAEDAAVVGTHWSIDLGAEDLTRELAGTPGAPHRPGGRREGGFLTAPHTRAACLVPWPPRAAAALNAPAVIARFSRLLCDCNRPLDAPTLFRTVADGKPIALNQARGGPPVPVRTCSEAHADPGTDRSFVRRTVQNVTAEESQRRLTLLYDPFHAAADAMLREYPSDLVFSVHSFTDLYEGQKRQVEIGILYNDDDAVAVPVRSTRTPGAQCGAPPCLRGPQRLCAGARAQMTAALKELGYDARLNEPWSGKEGFMYSADWHARDHQSKALMIEVRQDLLVQAEWRARFVPQLVAILADLGFT